jgi:hypothetical protein
MLERMKAVLNDLHDPDTHRAATAAYLIAVFGRATTMTLQTIRTYDPDHFNLWYAPKEDFMRDDPLLKFFNSLRNQFLHEGGVWHTGKHQLIGSRMADDDNGPWEWHFTNSPTQHDGEPIPSSPGVAMPGMALLIGPQPTVEVLARLYLAFLERLWKEAWEEFMPLAPQAGEAPPTP